MLYLISVKTVQYLKERKSGWASQLVKVLVRDSLLYFAVYGSSVLSAHPRADDRLYSMFTLMIANAVQFAGKDVCCERSRIFAEHLANTYSSRALLASSSLSLQSYCRRWEHAWCVHVDTRRQACH